MTIYQGPIVYTGNKRRLMPQIKPFIGVGKIFFDLFAGSGTVGLNSDAESVVFNDTDHRLIELLEFLANSDLDWLIKTIRELQSTFGMDDPKGRPEEFKAGYLDLRASYNQEQSPLLLYALVLSSFNYQIRFNKSGKFNMPAGQQVMNKNSEKKLREYQYRVNEIDARFTSMDFRDIVDRFAPLGSDYVFYADPPYSGTVAVYNEGGAWTAEDDRDLYERLDLIDRCGHRFVLSGVLEAKGERNEPLLEFSERYQVRHLEMSYANANYQRKDRTSKDDEVLITNF